MLWYIANVYTNINVNLAWFILVLNGIVHGYYPDVVPRKISSSSPQKWLSYDDFSEMNLVKW